MAGYLLLKNRDFCPKCGCKGRISHFNRCPNCGVMLFLRPIDFAGFETDGHSRNYYLWHSPEAGWIHRDHVINGLKPQSPVAIEEKLPEDYGMSTTPEAVAARGGKTVRKVTRRPAAP